MASSHIDLYAQDTFVLGIGARKFRTTVTDLGDRSVWTDTPADRQRKAQVRPIRFMVCLVVAGEVVSYLSEPLLVTLNQL